MELRMWVLMPISIALIVIIALVVLDVKYRRKRAMMTPEQRKEEDEAVINEGPIY
jgi:uncharacterized membrane protein